VEVEQLGGRRATGGSQQATEPANAERVYVLMGSLLHLASSTERRIDGAANAR
jgi:hypothetical protein